MSKISSEAKREICRVLPVVRSALGGQAARQIALDDPGGLALTANEMLYLKRWEQACGSFKRHQNTSTRTRFPEDRDIGSS